MSCRDSRTAESALGASWLPPVIAGIGPVETAPVETAPVETAEHDGVFGADCSGAVLPAGEHLRVRQWGHSPSRRWSSASWASACGRSSRKPVARLPASGYRESRRGSAATMRASLHCSRWPCERTWAARRWISARRRRLIEPPNGHTTATLTTNTPPHRPGPVWHHADRACSHPDHPHQQRRHPHVQRALSK